MPHDGDETLPGPVDEVIRSGVAEALVAAPSCGPDEVERAIRSAHEAGVAHEFAGAGGGLENCSGDGGPAASIKEIEITKDVFAVAMERGEEIDGLGARGDRRTKWGGEATPTRNRL